MLKKVNGVIFQCLWRHSFQFKAQNISQVFDLDLCLPTLKKVPPPMLTTALFTPLGDIKRSAWMLYVSCGLSITVEGNKIHSWCLNFRWKEKCCWRNERLCFKVCFFKSRRKKKQVDNMCFDAEIARHDSAVVAV